MKLLAIFWLFLCIAVPVASNENCEAAVDAADTMNVNQRDCDYSNEGLNGFLQKAFKKGNEGAVLETQATKSGNEKKSTGAAERVKNAVDAAEIFSLDVEVDQWANVALARTQLLPKAMEKCDKGFSIQDENYRQLAMGRIALNIEFICLK